MSSHRDHYAAFFAAAGVCTWLYTRLRERNYPRHLILKVATEENVDRFRAEHVAKTSDLFTAGDLLAAAEVWVAGQMTPEETTARNLSTMTDRELLMAIYRKVFA